MVRWLSAAGLLVHLVEREVNYPAETKALRAGKLEGVRNANPQLAEHGLNLLRFASH